MNKALKIISSVISLSSLTVLADLAINRRATAFTILNDRYFENSVTVDRDGSTKVEWNFRITANNRDAASVSAGRTDPGAWVDGNVDRTICEARQGQAVGCWGTGPELGFFFSPLVRINGDGKITFDDVQHILGPHSADQIPAPGLSDKAPMIDIDDLGFNSGFKFLSEEWKKGIKIDHPTDLHEDIYRLSYFRSSDSPSQYNFSLVGTHTVVPEPSSILSLLALGTLGAGLTLKRKLKSSKSTEKETTKVG